MTAAAKIRPMTGVPLDPHVRKAIEDLGDASLTEVAASAWSAQHQFAAAGAAIRLENAFSRAFGRELEAVSPERYDRKNPHECAGGTCDELDFGYRNDKLSIIVGCAKKDCPQELHGPVNGIVELGRVLSLIEDEKEEGATKWRCQPHREGAVV